MLIFLIKVETELFCVLVALPTLNSVNSGGADALPSFEVPP